MTKRDAPQNGRGGPPPTRVRCVLLSGPGRNNPAALIAGLTARGADVHVSGDAPGAMARVAQGANVLIVNEPRTVRRLPELLAAVRRHYPVVQLWAFESTMNGNGQAHPPALRRINGDNHAPPASATGPSKSNGHGPRVAAQPQPTAANAAPAPKMPQPAPQREKPGTQAASSSPRVRPADIRRESVTAEELAMLLNPLPSESNPEQA